MALPRTTVTGEVTLPNGAPLPDGAHIVFTLRRWDKDDDTVAVPGPIWVKVIDGEISVDLIRTAVTDRQTTYDVGYIYRNQWTGRNVDGYLGRIAVSGAADLELADLLALSEEEPDMPDALAQAISAMRDAMQAAQVANAAAYMALVGTGAGLDNIAQALASSIGYGANSFTAYGQNITLNVAPGDIWSVKGGIAYQVLPVGAASYEVITSGGVKLKQLYANGEWYVSAIAGQADLANITAAVQNMIARLIALCAAQGHARNLPNIVIPAGRWRVTDTLRWPPFIKVRVKGKVLLDFSTMPADSRPAIWLGGSGTDVWTVGGSFRPQGNDGPTLSGAGGSLEIMGPGRGSNSTGIRLGNAENMNSPIAQMAVTTIDFVTVGFFGYGFHFISNNLHMVQIADSTFWECNFVGRMNGAESNNSGERMTFRNVTMGSCDHGIESQIIAFGIHFINCSHDFSNSAILMGSGSSWSTYSFTNGHFEKCNEDGIIFGTSAGDHNYVRLRDMTIVPTTYPSTFTGNPYTRPDGRANPFGYLFNFRGTLEADGLRISGGYYNHWGERGFFMISDLVELRKFEGIDFYGGAKQFPAKSMIKNLNPHFRNYDDVTPGSEQAISGRGIPGWTVGTPGTTGTPSNQAINSMTMVTDATTRLEASGHSLKVTASAAGSYGYFQTLPFDIESGKKLITCLGIYAPDTTSDFTLGVTAGWLPPQERMVVPVVSFGPTSPPSLSRMKVVTEAAHGLSVGSIIRGRGSNFPTREMRVSAILSSAEFEVSNDTNSVVSGFAYEVLVNSAQIHWSTGWTWNAEFLWGDTDFQGFTGDRSWWAKYPATIHAQADRPAGYTRAILRHSFSGMSSGETVWVGRACAAWI